MEGKQKLIGITLSNAIFVWLRTISNCSTPEHYKVNDSINFISGTISSEELHLRAIIFKNLTWDIDFTENLRVLGTDGLAEAILKWDRPVVKEHDVEDRASIDFSNLFLFMQIEGDIEFTTVDERAINEDMDGFNAAFSCHSIVYAVGK